MSCRLAPALSVAVLHDLTKRRRLQALVSGSPTHAHLSRTARATRIARHIAEAIDELEAASRNEQRQLFRDNATDRQRHDPRVARQMRSNW